MKVNHVIIYIKIRKFWGKENSKGKVKEDKNRLKIDKLFLSITLNSFYLF